MGKKIYGIASFSGTVKEVRAFLQGLIAGQDFKKVS